MRRTASVLLATAVLLAGCSNAGESSSSGQSLEQAVGYSDRAWDGLMRHQDDAIVRCMKAHGFVYQPETDWNYLTTSPHGIFEIATPSAVRSYLDEYGYGMAQRVRALVKAADEAKRATNQDYFRDLPKQRKVAFVQALDGVDDAPGCIARATEETDALGLPSGGELGEAYGQAITGLYNSGEYEDWVRDVASCMRNSGVAVPGDDLVTAQRPFLKRMITVTGGKYSTDDNGRIRYSLAASRVTRSALTALPDLSRDEARTARIEGRCRDRFGSRLRRLVAEVSGPVIEKHPREVRQLRAALARYHTQ
jgi:hypothetical protein